MTPEQFHRLARNIIAVMRSIDPAEVYPALDHVDSEKRIRFRQDPYSEFLRADDVAQERIAAIAQREIAPVLERLQLQSS